MKKRIPKLAGAAAIALCVLAASCGKKEQAAPEASGEAAWESAPAPREEPEQEAEESPAEEADGAADTPTFPPLPAEYRTEAHAAYLDDPLDFKSLDARDPAGSYLLVASNEARLYGEDEFSFTASREWDGKDSVRASLKNPAGMAGESIPIGTILSYGGRKVLSGGEEWYESNYGYFRYQDNYNFFYKVSWEGKEGYVFGADLYQAQESEGADELSMRALLYKSSGRIEDFYPFEGLSPLPESVAAALKSDRLAIQHTNPGDIYLETDDLIDFYRKIPKTTPVFLTTDLFSHSQHLIFDKLLQDSEENYFAPRLLSVTEHFIAALREREDIPEDIKGRAIAYFQVPELILRAAPQKVVDRDSWRDEYTYKESDVASFIGEYGEDVRADYEHVMSAAGGKTACFSTIEDFSQYKPRGHYTKNGVLAAYFRAQMWYGRIHFTIARTPDNPTSEKESLIMEPVALAIVDTVKDRPDLYEEWQALFDPITSLIGMSDDLGFPEVLPLWKELGVTDFASWVGDRDNIYAVMALFNEKLRPPAISGNYQVSDKQGRPPMGWRFLGQRFTYDSYVHQQLSAPRIFPRDLVRGLDILAAFGSNAAQALLAETDYLEPDENEEPSFKGGKQLEQAIEKNKEFFDSQDDGFWTQTYYNNVLAQIRTQARFEAGAGYYFTQSPMWNVKALNSAGATWAELRHDTILYVKQVYAERAGGDDLNPTYRTLPLPIPPSYLEPNIPFYRSSLHAVQKLHECFERYGLLDDGAATKLDALATLYAKALEIATKESRDQAVGAEDNLWIRSVADKLALVVKPGYDSYVEDKDQLKMACIADVFTNGDYQTCLETGVGRPYKLYVPLNDGQGRKRIAVGYVPGYYEFYGPQSNRMSDEEWKEIVYGRKGQDMGDYEPFWMHGCVLP